MSMSGALAAGGGWSIANPERGERIRALRSSTTCGLVAICRALSLSETSSGWRLTENRAMPSYNEGSFQAHCWTVVDLFRSRAPLEAEIWILRQQINVVCTENPIRAC
jgi:hypothetical protein